MSFGSGLVYAAEVCEAAVAEGYQRFQVFQEQHKMAQFYRMADLLIGMPEGEFGLPEQTPTWGRVSRTEEGEVTLVSHRQIGVFDSMPIDVTTRIEGKIFEDPFSIVYVPKSIIGRIITNDGYERCERRYAATPLGVEGDSRLARPLIRTIRKTALAIRPRVQ